MSDRGLPEPRRLGKEAREDAEREAPGSAEIMLTFATVDEAAAAVEAINSDFERHAKAARQIGCDQKRCAAAHSRYLRTLSSNEKRRSRSASRR